MSSRVGGVAWHGMAWHGMAWLFWGGEGEVVSRFSLGQIPEPLGASFTTWAALRGPAGVGEEGVKSIGFFRRPRFQYLVFWSIPIPLPHADTATPRPGECRRVSR